MSMSLSTDEAPVSTTVEDLESSTATMEGSSSTVEPANCYCCGLTEECTLAYIDRVRERHCGRWICGLCAEAVKDEIYRSGFLISTEEAVNRHMNFCNKFRSCSPPENPTGHLITAVRQILRRSLDSPRALRSTPNSPRKTGDDEIVTCPSLSRTGSCFPALAS